jgi:hypothetical protein
MVKYSRAGSSRYQATYYFDIPAPSTTWDFYQNKKIAWQVRCLDRAGNQVTSTITQDTQEHIDYVDHAPSIMLKQPLVDKWYGNSILIRTEPSDNDNSDDPNFGIAEVQVQYSLDSSDGINGNWTFCMNSPVSSWPYDITWESQEVVGTSHEVWVRVRAMDNGNLYSPWTPRRIKVDNEPGVSANDYDDQWYNSDITITLSANDWNGSGIYNIYYKINNGPSQSIFNASASAIMPVITTQGANNTLEYWSVDNQSNAEKHRFLYNIKIDKTKPVISGFSTNDISKHTSVETNLVFTVNITDALSGLRDLPKFRVKLPGESDYEAWETMDIIEGVKYRGEFVLPLNKVWSAYAKQNIELQISAVDKANNEITTTKLEYVEDLGIDPPNIVHTPVTSERLSLCSYHHGAYRNYRYIHK